MTAADAGAAGDATVAALPRLVYEDVVRRALLEDLGRMGDLTSEATIPVDAVGRAHVVARAAGCVAGLAPALLAFELVDERLQARPCVHDGQRVAAGEVLAVVEGPARGLLTAERTALNLLGHLSGVATTTAGVVDAVAGTGATVVCTRKTTPGLRALEKHAVRAGGGGNHRFGLDDGILIKDNHVALAGGVRAAVEGARRRAGHMVRVELEVDGLDQLDEALALGVDAVLLDNMSLDELREAVARCRGRAVTEASGGIRPDTAAAIAATGVDLLSIGWLTHSAPSLDVALDVVV